MTVSEEERSTTVRIATELLEPMDKVIEAAKDEFGVKLFNSRCDFITKAVKEFLRKLMPQIAEED